MKTIKDNAVVVERTEGGVKLKSVRSQPPGIGVVNRKTSLNERTEYNEKATVLQTDRLPAIPVLRLFRTHQHPTMIVPRKHDSLGLSREDEFSTLSSFRHSVEIPEIVEQFRIQPWFDMSKVTMLNHHSRFERRHVVNHDIAVAFSQLIRGINTQSEIVITPSLTSRRRTYCDLRPKCGY